MATYVSAYTRPISINTTTHQITSTGPTSARSSTSTGDFSENGAITVVNNLGTNVFVYVGQVEGGWIGTNGPSGPTFFSNSNAPFSSLPITYSTAPFTVCFLAGTSIGTPAGETQVENLAVGDLVLTADGRAAPVKWVGIQTVVSVFADPLRSFPIHISAGALGAGLPIRDLRVSPDHALFLDSVLVQAGALVNGTTIVRETAMPERFTYFHVELEDHALILAEGVPAETFLDTVTRQRFDNYAEYEALYGDTGATIAEMDAPRIKSARQLPAALRARLAARAEAAGTAVAAA
jgi:hypothetical protein